MRESDPDNAQVAATQAVVRWYFANYFRTADEPGTLAAVAPAVVGGFGAPRARILANDGAALFRLLVASTLFQRRRDWVVQRSLHAMSPAVAREMTSKGRLEELLAATRCGRASSLEVFVRECDVAGRPASGRVTCTATPEDCHVKRHAVALRRYASFGKMPSSVALMLRHHGIRTLPQLREAVLAGMADEGERAVELERVLCSTFRASKKIVAMFLSWLCNPDLTPGAPWAAGIDWTHFVVVDSNVDAFLARTGYGGPKSYDGRRVFVQKLARRIDLKAIEPRVHSYNPRMVQQAIYIFMSRSNRLRAGERCSEPASSCRACPPRAKELCPV